MRQSIKEFVKICAELLPISDPIYEFGSLQVEGQEGFANLRPLFPNKTFIGADMRPGPGVDLILDLHRMDLPSEVAGCVLLMDTLEHVEFPNKAIEEVHRILKPEGLLIMSSVMNFGIHDYPSDFWRFTPSGFASLLGPFTSRFVDFAGASEFPHTVVGVGSKGKILEDLHSDISTELRDWKIRWRDPSGSHLIELATMITPPILFIRGWVKASRMRKRLARSP